VLKQKKSRIAPELVVDKDKPYGFFDKDSQDNHGKMGQEGSFSYHIPICSPLKFECGMGVTTDNGAELRAVSL
jgi:hypothetical protein